MANADDCVDIESFGKEHKAFLREYFTLENGIPSHDTINRVFSMVSSEYIQSFRNRFNELLSAEETKRYVKILSIDGKTQLGNTTNKKQITFLVLLMKMVFAYMKN